MIRGEGKVILNEKEHILKEGDSIEIPIKTKHRMINETASDLEFVEVQTGTYFGEDDITRYADEYGRL